MSAEEARRLFAAERFRKLLVALKEGFERRGASLRSVTVRDLDPVERQAVADLLGARVLPETSKAVVNVMELDRELRGSRFGLGAREAVEAVLGPVEERSLAALEASARRERMWARAWAHEAVRGRPAVDAWLEEMRRFGMLQAAATTSGLDPEALLDLALAIVEALPAAGEVQLPIFAADLTGDPHALDHGQPLGRLVLRAAMHLAGWEGVPVDAFGRRRLWGEVGVLCDSLSCEVLVLGLRNGGSSYLARQLDESAREGEPRRVTLRELRRHPLSPLAADRVFVCENPGLVQFAAERLGARCPPLVCVEGVPTTAGWVLLETLGRSRIQLRFHGDFDWAGLRIGNLLHQRVAATPWRFGAADYLKTRVGAQIPLAGEPVAAAWDGDLKQAMLARGVAVHEEQVREDLLADLADVCA
ncbi:MAG: TIGR02679 family protein [Myxococcota bacterium]